MILTIAKKEIQQNLKSFKFMVITLLILVTVLSSLYIMYNDYLLRVENYEILRPISKQPIAIVPPTSLSIFVKGLDESIGRSYNIRFGGQITVGSVQQYLNKIFLFFSSPDLFYIIKAIMSLCALLFAFDTISGEKEAHTLGLLMSNTISRTSLVIGKWIGGYVSFTIPFVVVFLLGTSAISLSPHVQMDSDIMIRLGIFFLSSLLYLVFFFSLGLFISCITHESASSLVMALLLWTLAVFIVPNIGSTAARQFVKIQSVEQLEMKRQHIWIKEIFEFNKAKNKGDISLSFNDVQQAINRENDKLMADYRSRFRMVVSLSKSLTRFSPAAIYTFLATDVAGTGIPEEDRVKTAVLNYKDMLWNKPTDSDGNIIGDFPAFTYRRRTIREVMNDEGFANFIILVLYAFVSFTAAYVAFLRYDVR